jgi:hypothetical protein
MKSCVLLLTVVAGTATVQGPPTIIGSGWGLDHVIVGVKGPEVVKDVLESKLGFSAISRGKSPSSGVENTIIPLPPAPYIEIVWPYQDPAPDARLVATLVRKKIAFGGGPAAYNVDVSDASQTADAMRQFGLRVNLPPTPMRVMPDGSQARGPWQFADINLQDQAAVPYGVPGGPGVGFIAYTNAADRIKPDRFQRALERAAQEAPDSRRPTGEISANTARTLRSVWVAVPNVIEALKQAARFGFSPTGSDIEALGETGEPVQCGGGTIVFFEPKHPDSKLSSLVRKKGLGPFGISVGVANLKSAQRIIQEGTQATFEIRDEKSRRSFIVPAELAAGTVFQFVQE